MQKAEIELGDYWHLRKRTHLDACAPIIRQMRYAQAHRQKRALITEAIDIFPLLISCETITNRVTVMQRLFSEVMQHGQLTTHSTSRDPTIKLRLVALSYCTKK